MRHSTWIRDTAIGLGVLLALPAAALPLSERWVVDRVPTPEQLTQWQATPSTTHFLWNSTEGDPTTADLEVFETLAQKHSVTIQLRRIPTADTFAVWRRLARLRVEVVFWDVGWPSATEIENLDQLQLPKAIWVSLSYPDVSRAQVFAGWKTDLSFTFASGKYPRFVDRDGLAALPARAPLLIISGDWPWNTQMDLLNLLPQPKRLRILDIYPSDQHWLYLDHIRNLDEIQLNNRFAPPQGSATWKKFGERVVKWTLRDWMPSASALKDFAGSHSAPATGRKIILDQDFPLSAAERKTLEALPCPVEWIHAVR